MPEPAVNPRKTLDKWAACLPERKAILAFLDWCADHDPSCLLTTGATWPLPMNPKLLLDEYHEIDQAQLERERRALLEEQCRVNADD